MMPPPVSLRPAMLLVLLAAFSCAAPARTSEEAPALSTPDARAAAADVRAPRTPDAAADLPVASDAQAEMPADSSPSIRDATADTDPSDLPPGPIEIGENGLPKPWKFGDVGKVPTPGRSSYKDGQFTVEGSGFELWHHIDFFHTAYHAAKGDATLTAKVVAVEKVTNGSAAGLIARFDPKWDRGSVFVDPGFDPHLHPEVRSRSDFQTYVDTVLGKQPLSPGVMIFWTNGNVVYAHRWQTLGSVGGWGPGPQLTQVTGVPLPVWLKIERRGNLFKAFYATDGKDWKTIDGREPSYTEEIFKRQSDPNSVHPEDPYVLGMFYTPKLAGTKAGKASFTDVAFEGVTAP